jgi:hypothetical protein
MNITTALLMMLVASLMLISSVEGHEMFEHRQVARVQGIEVPWYAWLPD